jgi:methylmalonyl-CoA carboxyltransferase small subunit
LKLKIAVNGKVYEVEVEASEPEPPQPAYLPPAGPVHVPAAPSAPPQPNTVAPVADENKVCRSPVAGVVVRASAQVGQSIQVNDALMVLEAMKMETVITSPIAGTIAKVNVKVGDAVQGGQVLVEFA